MAEWVTCQCGGEAKLTPTGKIGKHFDRRSGDSALMKTWPTCEWSGKKPPETVERRDTVTSTTAERMAPAVAPGSSGGPWRDGPPPAAASEVLNPERPAQSLEDRAAALAAPPSQDDLLATEPTKTTRRKRAPLDGRAAEISAEFDEMFFSYQHARPRSLQPTIGPSEAGSDCMRKIAMKLSQRPEVNYEKDSWPAWVGTQGHNGMEEMLRWYNESTHSQRFLIETALQMNSTFLPRGHSDAFDRVHGQVRDWKFPGKSALSKMHLNGCPGGYRKQLHIYGYGMELAGETVREVALVALPREGGSLADKYVFVEAYDREIAVSVIKRVEAIGARLQQLTDQGDEAPWLKAPKTPDFLCNWCPWYLPNDTAEIKGCNGKAI